MIYEQIVQVFSTILLHKTLSCIHQKKSYDRFKECKSLQIVLFAAKFASTVEFFRTFRDSNSGPDFVLYNKKIVISFFFLNQHLVNEEAAEKHLNLFKYLLFVPSLNESFLSAARKPFRNEFSHEKENLHNNQRTSVSKIVRSFYLLCHKAA